MGKVEKNIEKKKALTLRLSVPCGMVVASTRNALDADARTFTYYERADLRGTIDSIADAMEDGEPLARDVQDALDEAAGAVNWRVCREGLGGFTSSRTTEGCKLNDKYKERPIVVVKNGCAVSLDDVGWIEYTFPVEYVGDEEK